MSEVRGGTRGALARLVLVFAGLLVGLGLGEIALRIALPDFRRHYVHEPNLRWRLDPAPGVMPGVSGPSRFLVNADGVRGDELGPGYDYRILAVGGSTTECLYLDQEEAWPYRIQELLDQAFGPAKRSWVGNIGRSGRRTREHLVQLEYVLAELGNIDAVILLLGANDIMRRLAEDDRYDPQAWARPEAREALLAAAFQIYPSAHARRFGLAESAIGSLLTRWWLRREAQRDAAEIQMQGVRGENYARWREFRASTPELRARLPDLAPALQEYASNLEAIARVARGNGARVILMAQPALYQPDLPQRYEQLLWMGGVGDFNREAGHAYYTAAAMAEAFERYNAVLLDFCARADLECIDLSRIVPRDLSSFYDDVHFNESGADRVARAVFEHLRRRPPFTDR
ncbi:MAG: GDSL-type esterase/lipase family protein [Myxococcales bacterium]|nr:GDSL-type esterase/lipase family protein [Myxococcales bacterium]MDH5307082.1 GDSL-type esterase/lipase family protein [Myxococcales bacterium]MDH5567035.1 GDSL-type esterase/lipase family protein [Myxococcales bacterium]